MSFKMHSDCYNALSNLIRYGKKFSPYRPWPDPTIALLCIYGWAHRTEPNGDWVEITPTGLELHAKAVVR